MKAADFLDDVAPAKSKLRAEDFLDAPEPVPMRVAAPASAPESDAIFDPMTGVQIAGGVPFKPIPNSVMNDPGRRELTGVVSRAPFRPEVRAAIENQFFAARPAQRQGLIEVPGAAGDVLRDMAARTAAAPAPVPSAARIDPRAEFRSQRLVEQGLSPEIAPDQAAMSARQGIMPGREVGQATSLLAAEDEAVAEALRENFNANRLLNNPVVRGVVKGGEMYARGVLGMNRFIADAVGADQYAQGFADRARRGENIVGAIGTPSNYFERQFEGAVASITQQLPALFGGALMLPGRVAQAGSLAAMGVQSFGQTYDEGRNAGQDPLEASLRAGQFAALEIIGERFGLGEQMQGIRAIAKWDMDEAVRMLARATTREVPGEQLTTVGQFLVDQEGAGIGLRPEATVGQLVTEMRDTLVQTLMQGGTMIAGGGAFAYAGQKVNEARDAMISPERQVAQEIERSVRGSEFVQPAEEAARELLNPDNAQLREAAPPVRMSAEEFLQDAIDNPPEPRQPVQRAPKPDALGRIEPTLGEPTDNVPPRPEPQLGQEPPEQPEPETETAPEPAAATPATQSAPAANATKVSTASGRQIDVEYQVVEAADLQAASGELQPRDRSRDSSDAQIAQIAGNLDPQRLGFSAEADRGAPIVGDDNIIESGNGRVKAIVRAYAEVPERGQAYRDFLVQNGYPQAQNMSQPVLIRRRTTPLDPQARRQFVIEANESATMSLSASEQAMADAKKLSGDIMEALQGQDIKAASNRDFVRMFIGRVVSPSQANAMTDPDGGLSVDGLRRIQAALIAKAYDNGDILVQLVESMDMESKSIGTAFLQAAPDFAKLKQEVADGLVKPEMDVTPQLVEAAQLTIRLRDQRIKPEEYFKQQGMFDNIDPLVQEWVRNFYNNKNRAAAADKIAEILQTYVDMARQQLVGQQSLMGDEPQPIELVKAARQRVTEPTAGLFGETDGVEQPSPQADGGSIPQDRKQVRRSAVSAERTEPGQERRGVNAGSGRRAGQDQAQEAREEVDGTQQSVRQEGDRAGNADPSPAANQSARGVSNTDLAEKVSFTDRQSVFRDAFAAAGIDPDIAENLPPQEQFRILSRLLKDTYKLPLVEMSERMNLRLGVDQLLDAYRNLQYMVHVLDLPQSAIGLNGSLGLVLRDQVEYLGAFYPAGLGGVEGVVTQTPTIVLPRRSNSFAHEWGHAFDFWVMGLYDQKNYASQLIRKDGTSAVGMNDSLGGAFANLMNTIFFDQAKQSAEILELERQLTVARSEKRKQELTEKLKNMREGASASVNSRSRFYRSSQELGNPGYYLMPAEMLARSFEAYISFKVGQAGGTTEFIGKGDDAYLNDVDQYMKLAFPKTSERAAVFAAYDQLFDVVREKAILNQLGEASADKPLDDNVIDPLQYFRAAERNAPKGLKGLIANEREAIGRDLQYARRMATRPSDGKTRMERIRHRVRDIAFSNRGVLFQIRRRYRGNDRALRALNDIIKRIATDPGRARQTFSGGVFDEAVEREINKYGIQLANIVKNHGIQDFTDAENQLLRKVLTMLEDEEVQAPMHIQRAAAALRRLMNDTFYYLRNAGVDVGVVRQGYLTRILDEAAVFGDQPGFVKDATRLYALIFEREVAAFAEANVEDFPKIASQLVKRYQQVVRLKKRQEEMNLPKFKKAEEFAEFRAVMGKVNDFLSKIAAAEKEGEQDRVDELNAQLQQFVDENLDALDEARDLVKDLWSDAAANEWAFRVQHGKFNSWESNSPTGYFLKQRTLPPEADRIMAKWYLQDPLETIETYLTGAVRKAEYNRRFGVNQFRKGDPAFKSLESLLEELSRGGIQKDDVDQVRAIIHQVTGQSPSEMPSGLRWLTSAVQGIGTMVLLGRVVATSLAEPIAVSIQTGNSLDAFRALVGTLREIVPTASVRERRLLSDVLGVNGSLDWSDIVTNRLGGIFEGDPKLARLSNRFFRRVGLTGLTRAQRRSAMAIGVRYFAELGRDITENNANARFARDELIDFGLDPTYLKDFAEYVSQFTERLPTPEEVQGKDLGAQLSVVVMRLVNQSIQNPKAIDRPWAANTNIGRMTYGLLSFNLAFFRNAMAKSFNKVMREAERGGKLRGAQVLFSQVAAPFAALYFGHLVVTIMREALLNPEKLAEEEKKKRLETYLLQLALTRSGFTGLLDVPFNAFTSVKYERDMSNLFIGAVPAYIGQSLDKIVKYFVKNSANTNTGEYNAIRGMYELLAVPTIAYGAAALPGGAVLGASYGVFNAMASSPTAKNKVAEALVGKKDGKKKGEDEAPKSGGGGASRTIRN